MPSIQNQRKQLALLLAKTAKTSQDEQQIAALERKLVVKSTTTRQQQAIPRPQRQRNPNRRSQIGAASQEKRDGTETVMSPLAYKQLMMKPDRTGETASGRAWHHLALHPPSAPDAAFAGLPDFTSTPRVTPQYITNWDVAWDAALFDTAPASPTTFDVYMAIPDIPEMASFYFLHDVKNDADSNIRVIRTSTMGGILDTTHNTFNGLQDLGFSMTRMTSSSVTGIYTGTTLGDAGVIYAASISPIIDQQSFACIQTIPGVAAGVAVPTITPAVENSWEASLAVLPRSPTTIVQRDPLHYKGRAREGVFAVQKFDESLMGYKYTACGSGRVNLPATAAPPTFSVDHVFGVTVNDTATSTDIGVNLVKFAPAYQVIIPSGQAVNLPHTNTVNYLHGGITPHSGMAWTIIRIDGLSIEQGESFTFERRITLDSQVPANSAMVPFLKTVPDWDEVAIKAVMHGQRIMPSGMPSSCNGFMDWIRSAFSFLNKNRKSITDVVKILPIPGAAIAADIADNVIPTVNGMLSGSTV